MTETLFQTKQSNLKEVTDPACFSFDSCFFFSSENKRKPEAKQEPKQNKKLKKNRDMKNKKDMKLNDEPHPHAQIRNNEHNIFAIPLGM